MANPFSSPTNDLFNITIDDTSPTIVYTPAADTFGSADIINSWNPSFNGTNFASPSTLGMTGQGPSFHITARDGATFNIKWNGTAIYLFGGLQMPQGHPASYSISLDSVPRTDFIINASNPVDPVDDVLASFSNLNYGAHELELTVHNPDNVNDLTFLMMFDRAIIESRLPPVPNTNASSPQAPSVFVRDVADNSITFRGQWSFQGGIIQNSGATFHTSTNIGDRAHLDFNGTAIAIEGFTSPLSGSYNIVVDKDIPVQVSARSSFNASTPSLLYYRTGLDPNVMHDLEIVNAGVVASSDVGTLLAISKVTVASTQQLINAAPSSPAGLSGGAIAAVAVGTSVAFLLVIALAVLFVRRRRAKRRKQSILVSPRFKALRRLALLPTSLFRPTPTVVTTEKDAEANMGRREGGAPVLDIRPPQSDTSDDIETSEEHHNTEALAPMISGIAAGSRTSQNSDGSFTIGLPELSPKGYVHVRTSSSNGQSGSSSAARRASSPPLSPPSARPRGPRDMHSSLPPLARESTRGILLPEERSPDADVDTTLIPPTDTNALRVNFQDESREKSKQRRESRYASAGGISLPQSLRAALTGYVPATTEPYSPERERERSLSGSERDSDPRHSFVESSKDPSVRGNSHSNSNSNSTGGSSRSRPSLRGSTHSVPSVPSIPDLPEERRRSLGFFMPFGRGPSSSHPSRSPNISLEPITLTSPTYSTPPRLSLSVPEDATPPDTERQTTGPTDFVPSPTDSVPATVSDIHFRHSSLSTFSQLPESRRGSSQRFSGLRPSHPPLPPTPSMHQLQSESRPFIVRKLLGMPTAGVGPFTPYNSPTSPAFGPRSPSVSISSVPTAGPSRLPDTPPVAGPSRLPDTPPPVTGPSRQPQSSTSSTPTGRSISFRTKPKSPQ